MTFLKNLSIRYKILIPVALLGCLMLVLGMVSFQSANQLMKASEEISGKYASNIEKLGDTATAYQTLRRVAFAHIVEQNKDSKQTLVEEADELKATISDLFAEYEKGLVSEEEKQSFEQFKADYEDYLVIYDQILNYSASNQEKVASAYANKDLREAGVALTAQMQDMVSVNKAGMQEAVEHQKAVYQME